MISEPLDAAGVEAVAAIPDPVLRNLWITQSYFGLNTRMQHAVGGADRTWCGFAVWASDTAGQSIRGEELPHLVVQLTDQKPDHLDDIAKVNRRLRPLRAVHASEPVSDDPLQRVVREALADVSEHIAHGNTLVYCELGPLLVAFVERCEAGDPATISSDEVQQLLQAAAGGHRSIPSSSRRSSGGGRRSRRPTTRRGPSPSSPPTCSPSPTSSAGCSRTSRRR